MSATIIEFKPKPVDDETTHREWRIGEKLWNELLGMTPRQSERAFRLCFRDRDRSYETRAALSRYIEALRIFEPVLSAYREELLKNMDIFCPRAAERIRDGKPPRRGRKRPAVDEAGSPR